MKDLTGDQHIGWRVMEEFYSFLSVEPCELCGHQEANEGLGEFKQDYLANLNSYIQLWEFKYHNSERTTDQANLRSNPNRNC